MAGVVSYPALSGSLLAAGRKPSPRIRTCCAWSHTSAGGMECPRLAMGWLILIVCLPCPCRRRPPQQHRPKFRHAGPGEEGAGQPQVSDGPFSGAVCPRPGRYTGLGCAHRCLGVRKRAGVGDTGAAPARPPRDSPSTPHFACEVAPSREVPVGVCEVG